MSWRILIWGLLVTVMFMFTLGMGLTNDARPASSSALGAPAPAFELARADGTSRLSLASLRGAPVVVSFWATWCEACRQEHEVLQRASLALEGRVRFVGVAADEDPIAVRRFLEDHGGRYPMLLDERSQTAAAWGVTGLPTTFVLDARGAVVAQIEGPISGALLVEKLAPLFAAPAR